MEKWPSNATCESSIMYAASSMSFMPPCLRSFAAQGRSSRPATTRARGQPTAPRRGTPREGAMARGYGGGAEGSG
eukprot:15478650-Alexandrium_andersonii.AAC.1